MPPTQYAVVNRSTLADDASCLLMHLAVVEQLRCHVAPAWDRCEPMGAFVSSDSSVPSGFYPIYIVDDADAAGLLGYHAEDSNGVAYARVFVRPVLSANGSLCSGSTSVSVILSHEAIELLVDPSCQLWAGPNDGALVAYEACDPVEDSSYTVTVTHEGASFPISVSNFVLPSWFDAGSPASPYDRLGTCPIAGAVSRGGYAIVRRGAERPQAIFGSSEGQDHHTQVKPAHAAARASRRTR